MWCWCCEHRRGYRHVFLGITCGAICVVGRAGGVGAVIVRMGGGACALVSMGG